MQTENDAQEKEHRTSEHEHERPYNLLIHEFLTCKHMVANISGRDRPMSAFNPFRTFQQSVAGDHLMPYVRSQDLGKDGGTMTYLAIALNAFIMTLLVGAVSKFAIGSLIRNNSAAFGALCLSLGFAIGRYGGKAEFGPEAAALFSGVAGALFALLALWAWWFKRNRASHND